MSERVEDVESIYRDNEGVMDIVQFVRGASQRAVCQPKVGQAD